MKYSKIFLSLLFYSVFLFFFTSHFSFAQETEKPQAAVAPVAFMGEMSEIKRQIIFNKFQEKLTKRFSVISQKEFEKAQEAAYQALDLEQCTEEHCIRKIQEILQVENLFILQILAEEEVTQLSLTLITLEDKKVETDLCEACKIAELNRRVSQLVEKIIARSTLPVAQAPSPKPEQRMEEKPFPTAKKSSRWI